MWQLRPTGDEVGKWIVARPAGVAAHRVLRVTFIEIGAEKRHTGVVKTMQRDRETSATAVAPGVAVRFAGTGVMRSGGGRTAEGGARTAEGADRSDGGTRAAVIRLLLDRPATAAEVAQQLGISAAGVRRHLDALADEGAVRSRESRTQIKRGRGRPAREYLLTDTGRSRLPHAYDGLAVQALEFVERIGGEAGVLAFARARAEALIDAHQVELAAAADADARIDVLARALTGAGYSATVNQVGVGRQLCQHHCPVAHVAVRFPQLCHAELDVFAEAIGGYAQRLATIAHGDSFCTTFVPGTGVVVEPGNARPPAVPAVSRQGRKPL